MGYDIARLPWLLPTPDDFSATIRVARAAGCLDEAELCKLAGYANDVDAGLKLAKLIARHRAGFVSTRLSQLRLAVLSSSTTSYLVPMIVASAPRHGVLADVYVGEYGQFAQEIYGDGSPMLAFAPDAVLLSLEPSALGLSGSYVGEQTAAVEAALSQLRWFASGIVERTGATLILPTLVEPVAPWSGHNDLRAAGSMLSVIRAVNAGIVDIAAEINGVVLDVNGLAGQVGRDRWFDRAQWFMAKLPFALELTPLYADHVARVLGAMRGKMRKCLVLDLDNTLWGGIIGDDGVEGIRLGQGSSEGEAFQAIQDYALELTRRGIVLAVCSKNEEVNALLPFQQHEEMRLKREDIAVFVANWTDKASNLQAIAKALNIGTDALLFLDDNPAERARVRQMLPEVAVPEVSDDPATYPLAVAHSGWFETIALTEDDTRRAEQYRANAERTQVAQKLGSIDEYLASLEMVCSLKPFDKGGRSRITQLINKSNQFNVTTRRYTEAEIADVEQDPTAFALQVRLVDRFGDNGMISVIIFRAVDALTWECDTWLMSCRVLGRRVEEAVLQAVIEAAQAAGVVTLVGRYIPSAKNGMVADLFGKLGFHSVALDDAGASTWALSIGDYVTKVLPFKFTPSAIGNEHERIDA